MSDEIELTKAVAVTAELTGTDLTEAAKRIMVNDLSRYNVNQVLGALVRCRRELRGRLTVAEVIHRLDDGRPGPEEAWAMMPKSEDETIVWTDEMAQAFGVASGLDNDIQARMAFVETYKKLVSEARDSGRPVKWTPSLGHDPNQRESALLEAAQKGRLSRDHVSGLLPNNEIPNNMKPLIKSVSPEVDSHD